MNIASSASASTKAPASPLGEILMRSTSLERAALERALRHQADSGERIGDILLQLGRIGEADLAAALSEQLGLELAQDSDYPHEPVLDGELSRDYLVSAGVVPLRMTEQAVVVAMADPLDDFAIKAIGIATGKPVEVKVGVRSAIEAASRAHSQIDAAHSDVTAVTQDNELDADDVQQLRDLASGAPTIQLVNSTIARAYKMRASDIHIEPFEHELKVRFRIDGVLRNVDSPPPHNAGPMISRIKVLANLNIAERRLPQDGRIKIRIEGRDLDIRVSCVPTMYGESVVLRLLDQGGGQLELASLGFSAHAKSAIDTLLARPHGIVLVTGPTGSGKTTTLYAALEQLNTPDRKVLTVEDPVEYQMRGINQIQVKPDIGLSFASALRSMLRQDPDVIMIGEMRDLETAQIAVQSALTGHKVFSTLHTNDAASSITRLLDMGIEDYLLTSTVNGIVAQRLVRRLCHHCKRKDSATAAHVAHLDLDRLTDDADRVFFAAVGCEHCDGIGYKGRTTVVEPLVMSDALRSAVLARTDADTLRRLALDEGMVSMYDDGLLKALAGETTLDEVLRVTQGA